MSFIIAPKNTIFRFVDSENDNIDISFFTPNRELPVRVKCIKFIPAKTWSGRLTGEMITEITFEYLHGKEEDSGTDT